MMKFIGTVTKQRGWFRIRWAAIALPAALAALGGPSATAVAQGAAPSYPPTMRGPQVDDFNGVRVADPYRWLENISSPEVHAWVVAQHAVTESYLGRIARRKEIQGALAWTSAYSKTGAPCGGG